MHIFIYIFSDYLFGDSYIRSGECYRDYLPILYVQSDDWRFCFANGSRKYQDGICCKLKTPIFFVLQNEIVIADNRQIAAMTKNTDEVS